MDWKLSYSIYLWHWPIFAFIDYELYDHGWQFRGLLKITLTTAASLLSYFLIESPSRTWINRQKRRSLVFAVATILVAAVAIFGINLRNNLYLDARPQTIAEGGIEINRQGKGPHIALIGDSQGSMYGLTMLALADSLDGRLHILSNAGGNPFVGSTDFKNTVDFFENIVLM